jgi:heat shock protein HslJ
MTLFLAVPLTLLLVACTTPVPADTPPGTPPGTDALAQVGRWNLQGAADAQGRPIADVLPGGEAAHALAFADGRLSVEGGCNHIGGRYHVDADGRLVVSEMQSTLMACEDTALMRADSAVSALLEGRSAWSIAESWPEQLTLRHADGRRSHWVADRPAR